MSLPESTMFRTSIANRKPKGMKVKHLLQLVSLIVLFTWLLYQLNSSHQAKVASLRLKAEDVDDELLLVRVSGNSDVIQLVDENGTEQESVGDEIITDQKLMRQKEIKPTEIKEIELEENGSGEDESERVEDEGDDSGEGDGDEDDLNLVETEDNVRQVMEIDTDRQVMEIESESEVENKKEEPGLEESETIDPQLLRPIQQVESIRVDNQNSSMVISDGEDELQADAAMN